MVKGSERSMKENKPKLVLSPLDIKQRLVEALLRQYRGEGARATDFVNQQIDNLYDIFNSGSINISGDINEGLMDRLISLGNKPITVYEQGEMKAFGMRACERMIPKNAETRHSSNDSIIKYSGGECIYSFKIWL